jgi:hypothetical protein
MMKAGRALPEWSDDEVINFIVDETIMTRIDMEDAAAQKKANDAAASAQRRAGAGKALAEQIRRGEVSAGA